jgi:hypothetical protein
MGHSFSHGEGRGCANREEEKKKEKCG